MHNYYKQDIRFNVLSPILVIRNFKIKSDYLWNLGSEHCCFSFIFEDVIIVFLPVVIVVAIWHHTDINSFNLLVTWVSFLNMFSVCPFEEHGFRWSPFNLQYFWFILSHKKKIIYKGLIIGLGCGYSLVIYGEEHMLSNSKDEEDGKCTMSFISSIFFIHSVTQVIFLVYLVYAKCSTGIETRLWERSNLLPVMEFSF